MYNLLEAISNDLSIFPYKGESDSDYCYRISYSALALSLLTSSRNIESSKVGISKKAQTDTLQKLLSEYGKHLNVECSRFVHEPDSFVGQFRKVYEETGYLLTDDRGYEVIAPYGRTISFGCGHLFFGIPDKILFTRGLGFFTADSCREANIFEVFLREELTSEEYIAARYDPLDFDYRDIDKSSLQFFNPLLRKPPSSSWESDITTPITVARSSSTNTMYRILSEDNGSLLFADLPTNTERGRLISNENRRLLFALKEYYQEPVVAWANRLDDTYYEIKLSAQLPTREYYFLLLCSWPNKDVFDRISFITTADILPTIQIMLRNIGIKIIRR